MKKILYVTTISKTINAFLVPHIKHLIDQGYSVDIATNITDEINKELIDYNVKIFQIDFQRNPMSIRNKKAYDEIKKLQSKKKYDIVHVHTPVASFVTRLALKNEENLKIVYTCHGFHFYKGSSIFNWILFYPLEKLAAKWTDSLVTINSEDFEIASKFKLRNNGQASKMNGVGIEKEKYIIENFDRNEYRKSLNLKEEDFVILVLAELNKNKNHIQLIKAMNLLKYKYPRIKAIFAGSGPLEEELKNQIKENGLEEKVSLLGWRNDVTELINSSDVVGLFSKREGLGKCLLEAMICGKSVIATNTRGPRELIEQDVNGFMFDIGDVEATAKSIEKLGVEDNFRNEFEERVVETADKYLLDNVLEQLECIYEDTYSDETMLVGESL
ncbi:MAG: glycosyltransferase family 4 protein [Clostridium sp.]